MKLRHFIWFFSVRNQLDPLVRKVGFFFKPQRPLQQYNAGNAYQKRHIDWGFLDLRTRHIYGKLTIKIVEYWYLQACMSRNVFAYSWPSDAVETAVRERSLLLALITWSAGFNVDPQHRKANSNSSFICVQIGSWKTLNSTCLTLLLLSLLLR